jgi:hypothetical protein
MEISDAAVLYRLDAPAACPDAREKRGARKNGAPGKTRGTGLLLAD